MKALLLGLGLIFTSHTWAASFGCALRLNGWSGGLTSYGGPSITEFKGKTTEVSIFGKEVVRGNGAEPERTEKVQATMTELVLLEQKLDDEGQPYRSVYAAKFVVESEQALFENGADMLLKTTDLWTLCNEHRI